MAVTKKPPVAAKKLGRPVGSKNKPKNPMVADVIDAQKKQLQYQKQAIDWESLAKKLQKALMKEMKKNEDLEWAFGIYRKQIDEQEAVIEQLENRSWLSRLFNLKG